MKEIKAILFDIGEVIIELDSKKYTNLLQLNSQCEMEISKVGSWEIYQDYEKGLMTCHEFYLNFCQKTKLNIDFETFKSAWNSLLNRVAPSTEALIKKLAKSFEIYALSNTNEIHFQEFRDYTVFRHFNKLFLSHEIGARKPHEDSFKKVIESIPFKSSQVLFIDDKAENIEGAKRYGLKAEIFERKKESLDNLFTRIDLLL